MMRKYVADFVCAFVITAVLFVCLGLLTNEGFFDNAIVWDSTENSLHLFGTVFSLDAKSIGNAKKLYEFNDVIFGHGFADAAKAAAGFVFEYLSDVFALLLAAGRRFVGAA